MKRKKRWLTNIPVYFFPKNSCTHKEIDEFFDWIYLAQDISSEKRKHSPNKQELNQNGLACISVPLSSLFTNCLSISNALKEPVSSLEEVIVILTLDKPLLSEYQRFRLNPMVLTVKSANEMPNNGMDYNELKKR